MWTSIRWQVPLGSMALGLIQGVPNLGGPIVTTSGLVFIAAATDDKLRASVVRLIPRADYAATRAAAPHAEIGLGLGTPYAAERTLLTSIFGIPCNQPPWGTLAAVDLLAGTCAAFIALTM